MATEPLYTAGEMDGRAVRHGIRTMTNREGQGRGRPGEIYSGGIGPVIGDIERTPPMPGAPGGSGIAAPVLQVLRGLRYPLTKTGLAREAAERGAPGGLMDLLAWLPDRVYASAEDVAMELRRPR